MAPESRPAARKGRSEGSKGRISDVDDAMRDDGEREGSRRTTTTSRGQNSTRPTSPEPAYDGQYSSGYIPSPPRAAPTAPVYESAGQTRQSRFRTGSVNERGLIGSMREAQTRPRTRTLDQLGSREVSPSGLISQNHSRGHRQGMSSVHSTASTASYTGIDDAITSIGHLSTVPGEQLPIRPAAMRKGSSRTNTKDHGPSSSQPPEKIVERPTPEPPTIAAPDIGRMVKLMQSTRGRMEGPLAFRRGELSPWAASYCSINDEAGSLVYETKNADNYYRTLVPDLRGCHIQQAWDPESQMLYLDILPQNSRLNIHLRPHTRDEFESWLAALMCWHPMRPKGIGNRMARPQESAVLADRRPTHTRRQSESTKEAPIIKVGKMILWDTSSRHSLSNTPQNGHPITPTLQTFSSRKWQRVSCTLRENGEFKLLTEQNVETVAVIRLSQLCRYAVQRLDPSVLDNQFSIAIYPQYSASSDPPQVNEPIFVSLESRVLYEVWLVLLRAFTVPQLYGPKVSSEDKSKSKEATPPSQAPEMFRLERTLTVRVTDARLTPPMSPTYQERQPQFPKSKPADDGNGEGHFVEVVLDGEIRSKTTVKTDPVHPFWGEEFEFPEMPPVISVASILLKKRPPGDPAKELPARERSKQMFDGLLAAEGGGDAQGGFVFDQTCGRVDIYLDDLEPGKDLEKWWTVRNQYGQTVGEVNVKIAVEEHVILMAKDYQPMSEILHTFSNGLTLQIAQCMTQDLKRLSESLLNIFQVSGTAYDWLLIMIEEEIDGTFKESSLNSRFRISRRLDSNESSEGTMFGPHVDRELLVRDMGKNATVEANLLFRGNTLLTKSLDLHMRRLGKEYLEETLGDKLKEIADRDWDCEVDPNKISNANDLDRNWRKLIRLTDEIWKSIAHNAAKCPTELRFIFRHIRACAEDRYGDFLRSVSYSSVSGFLFLRFFCPAILNPKLFGLVKDLPKANARRSFTLIAKSIQGLANMSSFGSKEAWMEPMNAFMTNNRTSLKKFIDDVCSTNSSDVPQAPMPPSYSTPLQILGRLPETNKEGFPSLPYLIDHAGSHAALVTLWHDHAKDVKITEEDGEVWMFHQICMALHKRTEDCLTNAERAERPSSLPEQRWDTFVKQLEAEKARQTNGSKTGGLSNPDTAGAFKIPDQDRQLNLQMPTPNGKKPKLPTRPQSPTSGASSPYPVSDSHHGSHDVEEVVARSASGGLTSSEVGDAGAPGAGPRYDRFGTGNAKDFQAAREVAKVKERERRAKDKEEKRAHLRGMDLSIENGGLSSRHRSSSSGAVAAMATPARKVEESSTTTPLSTSAGMRVRGHGGSISSLYSAGNGSANQTPLSLTRGGRQMSEPRPSTSSGSAAFMTPMQQARERGASTSASAASHERHIISAVSNAAVLSKVKNDVDPRQVASSSSPATTIPTASPLTRLERDISARNKLRKEAPSGNRSNADDSADVIPPRSSSHQRERSSSRHAKDKNREREREKDSSRKKRSESATPALSTPTTGKTAERKRSVQELGGIMSLGFKRAVTPTSSTRRPAASAIQSSPSSTIKESDASRARSRDASASKSHSRAGSPFPQSLTTTANSSLSFFGAARRSSRPGSRSNSQPNSRPGSSRADSRSVSRPASRFGGQGTAPNTQPGSLAPSDVDESNEDEDEDSDDDGEIFGYTDDLKKLSKGNSVSAPKEPVRLPPRPAAAAAGSAAGPGSEGRPGTSGGTGRTTPSSKEGGGNLLGKIGFKRRKP